MALSLAEHLRRSFDLATLKRQARTLKTARHWQQANHLMLRCDTLRTKELRLYRECYDTRVEIECRRLLHDSASTRRELKPNWIGQDRFNAAACSVRHAEMCSPFMRTDLGGWTRSKHASFAALSGKPPGRTRSRAQRRMPSRGRWIGGWAWIVASNGGAHDLLEIQNERILRGFILNPRVGLCSYIVLYLLLFNPPAEKEIHHANHHQNNRKPQKPARSPGA
jgi:hypothetical protein